MESSIISTRKPPLSRHPAFAPLIVAWLAALLGGSIAVLPKGVLSDAMAQAPLALPAFVSNQIVLAALAALAGAGLGWIAARAIQGLQHRSHESLQTKPIEASELEVVEADPIENNVAEVLEPLNAAAPDAIVEGKIAEQYSAPPPEPVLIEAEVFEADFAAEPEEALDDMPAEAEPYDDAPFYADIDLSQLLGAPKITPAEPAEANVDFDPLAATAHVVEPQPEPETEPVAEAEPATDDEETPEVEPLPAPVEPSAALPQHGKAVNLLRKHDTQELAMPQLIERFAVALDDQRQLAQNTPHSYSAPQPPANMTQRLRALATDAHPAE